MAEEKKVEKKDRFKLAKEFKAFISRGNVEFHQRSRSPKVSLIWR